MPPPRAEPAAGNPAAAAPAEALSGTQGPPGTGVLPAPADMLRKIEALERRVATLETAYSELLAALSPRGGNAIAALAMARRYEQNLRNLLPSHRRGREAANDRESPVAAEPPVTRRRMQ